MDRKEVLALHDELTKAGKAIMVKKNQDYSGGQEDALANFRGSAFFEVDPAIGVMIRLQDKMKRIEAFVKNGTLAVSDEAAEDTLVDMINYTVLLAALLRDGTAK